MLDFFQVEKWKLKQHVVFFSGKKTEMEIGTNPILKPLREGFASDFGRLPCASTAR